MDTPTNVLQRLRDRRQRLVAVGAHSAITARLAELAGFDAIWLGSFEASAARGLPDMNLITSTEMAALAAEVRSACSLPVIIDADNGYGSDEAAVRAVRQFAQAGASAVCIEDNAFPKRCSFYEGVERPLLPVDEFVRRLEVVRRAAGSMGVIARTEALVAGLGGDEAVRRARAYVDAGADALFIQAAAGSFEEYRTVAAAVRDLAPLALAPTAFGGLPTADLHEGGVDLVIYANVTIRALVAALSRVLPELRRGGAMNDMSAGIATMEDVFQLTGVDDWIGPPEDGTARVRAGSAAGGYPVRSVR